MPAGGRRSNWTKKTMGFAPLGPPYEFFGTPLDDSWFVLICQPKSTLGERLAAREHQIRPDRRSAEGRQRRLFNLRGKSTRFGPDISGDGNRGMQSTVARSGARAR